MNTRLEKNSNDLMMLTVNILPISYDLQEKILPHLTCLDNYEYIKKCTMCIKLIDYIYFQCGIDLGQINAANVGYIMNNTQIIPRNIIVAINRTKGP